MIEGMQQNFIMHIYKQKSRLSPWGKGQMRIAKSHSEKSKHLQSGKFSIYVDACM